MCRRRSHQKDVFQYYYGCFDNTSKATAVDMQLLLKTLEMDTDAHFFVRYFVTAYNKSQTMHI
jgi:hypothetical protein